MSGGSGRISWDKVNARYERQYGPLLESELCSRPDVRVDVGYGQTVEVCRVAADPVGIVVFGRVHGGPPMDSRHFGARIYPLAPHEVSGGRGGRWPARGLYVWHLSPALPHRRRLRLRFGPASPDREQLQHVTEQLRQGGELMAEAVVAIRPHTEPPAERHGRLTRLDVPEGLHAELTCTAGFTATGLTLYLEPDTVGLGTGGPLWPQRLLPWPPGAERRLWTEPHLPLSSRAATGPSWPARPLPPFGRLLAHTLPGEKPMPVNSISNWQQFMLDPLAPGAEGLATAFRLLYRWQPVNIFAEVPSPSMDETVDLEGQTVTFDGGALDLMAWEPAPPGAFLIARPRPAHEPGDTPHVLAELRLMHQGASLDMDMMPLADGTLCFRPISLFQGLALHEETVELGVRGVGQRLGSIQAQWQLDG